MIKYEMMNIVFYQNYEGGGGSPSSEMEQAVMGVLRATRDLRQQLSATTMEQAGDLGQVTKAGQELVSTIRNLALANDIDRLQESSDRFHEYIEHILEVSSQTWPTHRVHAFACTCILSPRISPIRDHFSFRRILSNYEIDLHLSQQKCACLNFALVLRHIDY